jgi:hypothetical protein
MSFDGLNNEDTAWHAIITDEADPEIVYLGGESGNSPTTEPLLGKFEANNMRFAWVHTLQTMPDLTARAVWNLAQTSANEYIAALVATTSNLESLLYILDKNSGAPVLRGYKFYYQNAPQIKQLKPFETQMLHWQDSTILWVLSGHDLGFSWTKSSDSLSSGSLKSVALKLKVNAHLQTIEVLTQLVSENSQNTVYSASRMFMAGNTQFLVFGGGYRGASDSSKHYKYNYICFHYTASGTTE